MEDFSIQENNSLQSDNAWGHDITHDLQGNFYSLLNEEQGDINALKNVISSFDKTDNRFRQFVTEAKQALKENELDAADIQSAEMHLFNTYVQLGLKDLNISKNEKAENNYQIHKGIPPKSITEMLCSENLFLLKDADEEKDDVSPAIYQPCLPTDDLVKRKAVILQSVRKKMEDQKKSHVQFGDFEEKTSAANSAPSVFAVSPSEVTFYDYQPGKFYQMLIKVKNISQKTQRCRIRPTKTKFFSARAGKYPGQNGMIAPGLHCTFSIKFHPKQTIDYNDEIKILAEDGTFINVPLFARRKVVHLELPQKWSCGHCFLGERVEMIMTGINRDGEGKIWLKHGSINCQTHSELQMELKSIEEKFSSSEDSMLRFSCFSISPSYFIIKSTEKTKSIKITFTPQFCGIIQEYVTVVYENFDMKEYIIEGEGIKMTRHILSCCGYWNYPKIFESKDQFTEYFLRFDHHYPFQSDCKFFGIKNYSSLYLKYHWITTTPRLTVDDKAEKIETNAIRICPEKGVLHAYEIQKFAVKCCPKKVGIEHILLRLVIESIPEASVDRLREYRIARLEENSRENYVSVYLLDIDVKYECIGFEVSIIPVQIDIPGSLEKGIVYRHHFQMDNKSLVPVFFQWLPITEPHIIYVQPSVGYLSSYCTSDMELMISPVSSGFYEEYLTCKLHHQDKLLKIKVTFNICDPDVIFEDPLLNLGLIKIGDCSTGVISIRNKASANISWNLCSIEDSNGCMYISPNHGELRALERQKINVCFQSNTCCSLHSLLELRAGENIKKHLAVFAEVIKPEVCLRWCTYHATGIRRCQPFLTFVILHNQTAIQTKFHWGEPEGVDAASCSICFEHPSGVLHPKEQKYIQVSCTVCDPTSLHDVCVPCWIEGMDHPLYWSLSGDIASSEIICLIPDDRFQRITLSENGQKNCLSEPVLDLNFGDAVPLGTVVSRRIVLKNTGAIAYPFHTFFEIKSKFCKESVAIRTKHGRNSESKSSQRKVFYQLDECLKLNCGIAIVLNPSEGKLLPFSSMPIDIYCKTDIWGIYNESITVKISQFRTFQLNLHLTSVGLPLHFLNANKDSSLLLRFGRTSYGSSYKTRHVELFNSGPVDLTVNFSSFIIDEDDEAKMMDLMIIPNEKKESEIMDSDFSKEKLLLVDLIEHEGSVDEIHFIITPNVLTVPARGQSSLSVTFKTPLIKEAKLLNGSSNKHYIGYAQGTVELTKKDIHPQWLKMSKLRQFQNIVRFDYMAEAVYPRLFTVATTSDPLYINADKLSDKKMRIFTSETILDFKLTCNSPLSIKIHVEEPFYVKSLKKNNTTRRLITRFRYFKSLITILPSDILKLSIIFQLKRNEIENGIIYMSSKSSETAVKENLVFEKVLKISIPQCEETECHLLRGIVYLPSFSISPSVYDFGYCLVGEVLESELCLKNASFCTVVWQSYYESNTGVFEIRPTSGTLNCSQTFGVFSNTPIKIMFKPQKAVEYCQTIMFKAKYIVAPDIVVLRGNGTFDSKYQHC